MPKAYTSDSVTASENKKDGKNKGKLIVAIIALVVLLGYGGTYYFYKKYNTIKTNPNIEAQKEVESLVKKVGELMVLPAGETPTVATVADKEKIKDQQFFKNAENGDKLLAYTKAMKAILYRPSTHKIIEVAPIVINQPQAQTPSNNAPVAPAVSPTVPSAQ